MLMVMVAIVAWIYQENFTADIVKFEDNDKYLKLLAGLGLLLVSKEILTFLKRKLDNSSWVYGKVNPTFISKIKSIVGDESRIYFQDGTDSAKRELDRHARDMSFHKPNSPDVVVYPTSPKEVQAIVKCCFESAVPVVPRGAGSGLEGGVIPYSGGVVLDLMKMKKCELIEGEMQAVVGPGLKKSQLNDFLQPHGLLFGPDPASNPSIGGMASTRGSGLSTVMYGTTGENIISLLVVTPKGELVSKTSDIFYTFFFFFVLVGSYIPFLEPDTNKEKGSQKFDWL
eukprot:m.168242 g.168242  ORF g.168242 m.168242 type:complete len:284 (-) comp15313_c0_seq29:1265-2116(-)